MITIVSHNVQQNKSLISAIAYLLRFPILPYCSCDPHLRSDVTANLRENLEPLKLDYYLQN